MIKRDLLLASAMFCTAAAFAGTDMSVYQGSDVSVRVVNPNTKMKFAVGTIKIGDEALEMSKVDSIVLKHYVSVSFDGDKVNVSNPFDSVEVKVDGTSVEINSTYLAREIEYKFSGKSSNGNVIFSSLYKSKFEFDNLDLKSDGVNPPIYVLTKKNTEIHLTGNNSLADSKNDTVGATMRGKGQFEFKGNGSLDIVGSAGHGIQSSDYVEVKNGKITINALSDGIHVNDYYTQSGGNVNIVTGADGIDVGEGHVIIEDGNLTVSSRANGARGIRCSMTEKEKTGDIFINGGHIDIQLQGAGSRGIKADGMVLVRGGETLIVMSGASLVTSTDTTVTCGIKADYDFAVSDGRVVVICQKTAGSSRCIQADSKIDINGGVTTLYQNSTTKIPGCKKPNVVKSDGNLTVAKVGQLYVYSDVDYVKSYNVSNVVVNGVTCETNNNYEDDDDYVSNYILVEPDFWDSYSKFDK